MKRHYKLFNSARRLNELIDQYFEYIKGEDQPAEDLVNSKSTNEKPLTRKAEPPTLAGLILYLGFSSRDEFETCAAAGRYAAPLNRAKLRIEAIFEQKLLTSSSGGAIFALKSMGHSDCHDKTEKRKTQASDAVLKVEVTKSGPGTASTEKEVTL